MAKKFLFYDLETTGTNKCFDQIIQFAGIYTNEYFEEISRYNFFVKINPDTVPTPDASLVHHITIKKANTGICEYEAIKKIYTLFNTKETISIGYNNLNFDDEFLRFSFFRNLFPAYDHQYKNNCFRMDLYPIVVAYYLFDNKALKWPLNIDGTLSLKLEDINLKNGLYKGKKRMHDALTDVVVTLKLARKLKLHQNKMWKYLLKCFDKSEDMKKLLKLNTGLNINGKHYQQALMISGKFGYKEKYIFPVINLGQHTYYRNKWCFLRLDYPQLIEVNLNNLLDHPIIFNKKLGELPIIFPATQYFSFPLSITRLEIIKKNKLFLKENPHWLIKIRHFILNFKYPNIKNIDVDASLYYENFMNSIERKICQKFHKETIKGKLMLMNSMNQSYYERALRILCRMALRQLPIHIQFEFQKYIAKLKIGNPKNLPIDFKGNYKVSVPEMFMRIKKIRVKYNLTKEQLFVLDELEEYFHCM